ncbi:MAG: hypothetical protein COA78_36020 [Blastopirellula sp.]|nr:MAG: hypothetical protein COA78_36020 [Blastopirellula sp.]
MRDAFPGKTFQRSYAHKQAAGQKRQSPYETDRSYIPISLLNQNSNSNLIHASHWQDASGTRKWLLVVLIFVRVTQ